MRELRVGSKAGRLPLKVAGPFRLTEVNSAPRAPGLYVWYARLVLGTADTASAKTLESFLDSFSGRLERQRIRVTAKWNFSLEWRGELDPDAALATRRLALDDQALGPQSLALAAQLLLTAQHGFFQPLYIGKAEISLRSRLRQHADEFLRLRELRDETGAEPEGEDDLAQRAARLGLNEDQMVCYAIPVEDADGFPDGAVGAAISLVEFYLNTWATPLLGRK